MFDAFLGWLIDLVLKPMEIPPPRPCEDRIHRFAVESTSCYCGRYDLSATPVMKELGAS